MFTVSQPKKVYLERSDVLILFAMILLACGMMFSAGVLVGRSFAPPDIAAHGHQDTHLANHGKSQSKKDAARAPASVSVVKDAAAPGQQLKKSFQESKQRALNESLVRESRSTEPKSVRDARAFKALQARDTSTLAGLESTADRKPASQEDTQESPKSETKASSPAELPKNLKGLFERKPSSIENFEPVPGQFTVQVASYSTRDESQARVSLLRKSGFNDAYFQPIQVGSETWYRVAIGSFSTSENAQKVAEQVVRRRMATSFVVRRVD